MSGNSSKEIGKEIAEPQTVRFAWIAAQWAWNQTAKNQSGKPTRLRVTMTFQLPEEVGVSKTPHKITFNLTDRLREFQPANPFQQQIKTMVGLRGDRWIGKARIRRNKTDAVGEQHRRNIPDLVMSAGIDHQAGMIYARLWTPIEQIDLVFDQELTEKQSTIYNGAALYGTRPKKARPRDDFYDWIQYA